MNAEKIKKMSPEEKIQTLAKLYARLIKSGNAAISNDKLKQKVLKFVKAQMKISQNLSTHYFVNSIDCDIDFSDLFTENAPPIKRTINKLLSQCQELREGIEENWKLDPMSFGIKEELWEVERAYSGISHFQYYLASNLDTAPNRKKPAPAKNVGKPSENERRIFIEKTAKLYESASGNNLSECMNSNEYKNRLVAKDFYGLLFLSLEKLYQDPDSFKKFVRRYFKSERQVKIK